MERVSLVMGGATPIGRAVADRLVDEGHLVAILDGDPDGVARMEAEFDPDITLAFAVDVTDPEDMAEVVDAIAERFGPPTGLVLVAPAFPSTPFLESGTEAINAMLEQHVFGAMALVLLTAERMEPSTRGRAIQAFLENGVIRVTPLS